MNLKVLFVLLFYYSTLSIFFWGTIEINDGGWSSTIDLNATDLTEPEIDKGGFFTVGVSFVRYLLFIGFGIGLPSDVPLWFDFLFFLWQTVMNILVIAFIISSAWNG